MPKRFVLTASAAAFYAAVIWLAALVVVFSQDASRSYALMAQALSPEEQTNAAIEEALETLSLGAYEGASERRARLVALNERVFDQWQMASALGGLTGLVLLAIGALATIGEHDRANRLNRTWLWLCLVCLVIGVSAPMLSIVAQREVPLLGHVILRYESKGILTTVVSLYAHGHLFIAGALALSSLVLPSAKLALGFVAVSRFARPRRAALMAVHLIGRWSMTDVFVVAILLAVLAGQAGDSTDAWLGHGLWFFAVYAILSTWLGRRLNATYGSSNHR